MSSISCRISNSYTKKVADEAFEGDVGIAWAVLAQFMKEKPGIADESQVSPIQAKEYWEKQKREAQRELISKIPIYEVHYLPPNSTDKIGAVITGNKILLNTFDKENPIPNFVGKWYKQHPELFKIPGIMQKVTNPAEVNLFELYLAKYESLFRDSKSKEEKIQYALRDLAHNPQERKTVYKIEDSLKNDELSSINTVTREVTIKTDISEKELLEDITGKRYPRRKASKLKKAVWEELNKEGINEEVIKELISNPYIARQFLYHLEQYRAQHLEYLEQFNAKDLVSPENVKLEVQAFKTAFEKIYKAYTGNKLQKSNSVFATIAPYYNTSINGENYNEIKEKVQQNFLQAASLLADSLGITIKGYSTNIGGFEFSEGESAGQQVRELSYTFELDIDDLDKADLFASLMGDLGYERQEAVISYKYTEEGANAFEHAIKVKNLKGIISLLESLGITDFTIDNTQKTIKLLSFSEEDITQTEEKVKQLINKLGDNYEGTEFNKIKSNYLDRGSREKIYRKWLGKGQQDGNLSIYTRKALQVVTSTRDGAFRHKDLIQQPKVIDIWSTNDDKYSKLSNFNNGPVTVDPNFTSGMYGTTFKTVEGAFQCQKLAYTDAYTEEEKQALVKKFEQADGREAQSLGHSIKGLDRAEWDKNSEGILYGNMLGAFEQNEENRQLLLSTGEAILTHNKGTRGYNEKFPKLLMIIREVLKGKEFEEAEGIVKKLMSSPTTQNSSMPVIRTVNSNNYTERTRANAQWSDVTIGLTMKGPTTQYGVVIDDNLKNNWQGWQQNNPNGIVAYRVNYNEYNTPKEALAGRIGNPFSKGKGNINKGEDTVRKFYEWLITGNNFGEQDATEEYRQAIINKIKSTPKGSPILYYRDLGRASHATVIGYLINHKEILGGSNKEVSLSTQNYHKGDPQNNPDTDYVFTENAEAYSATHGISTVDPVSGNNIFPFTGTPKLNVSDMKGRNTAGIRTDFNGDPSKNAFGIVVKHHQHDSTGEKFVHQEGVFNNSEEDFDLFTSLNEDFFNRLESSPNKKVIFPRQMALNNAALPWDFAKWLQIQLQERYGLKAEIQKNPRNDYQGYGLQLDPAKMTGKDAPMDEDAWRYKDSNEDTQDQPEEDDEFTEEEREEYANYELPKPSKGTIKVDKESPLYKLHLQIDVEKINHRVEMIAQLISTKASKIIDDKIKELQRTINEGIATPAQTELYYDLTNKETRKEKGLPLVIDEALQQVKQDIQARYDKMQTQTKEQIEDDYDVTDGDYLVDQYRILIENYEYLFDMACDILETSEDIRFVREGDKVTTAKSNINEENKENQTKDDSEGNRATGNEGYGYSVRMLHPHKTSRAETREVLSHINKLDGDGLFETDDLGEMLYLKEPVVYSTLVNELSKIVHHPKDFNIRLDNGKYKYPALESLVPKYPWIRQLINKLHTNPNLGSILYVDLCKEFVSYWTQYEEKDEETGELVTKTKRANETVATQSVLREANVNYRENAVLEDTMLWDKAGAINANSAEELMDTAKVIVKEVVDSGKITKRQKQDLVKLLRSVGFNIDYDHLNSLFKKNSSAIDDFIKIANNISLIATGATELDEGNSLLQEYKGAYETIAETIGYVSEVQNSLTFRQGKSTSPSYSYPNYITFIKNGLLGENPEQFLIDEFGYDSFLFDKKTGKFKSYWIELFKTNKKVRKNLDIAYMNVMNGIEYKDWTHDMIILNFYEKYNSVPMGKGLSFAYYNFPIFSDSTMASFIKMPRFIRNYKAEVTKRMVDVAKQELHRMQKIAKRKQLGASKIARYDTSGLKFLFMPELNKAMYNGMPLIQYLNSLEEDDIKSKDKAIYECVAAVLEENSKSFWAKNSSVFSHKFTAYTNGEIVEDEDLEEQTRREVEEYYYNNTLAQAQIIQLMTTDLAYYKDYTEFQKRFKEVYASGSRLNTQSRYGREVERSIYLSDKILTSPSYTGIKTSLEQAFKDGLISKKDMEIILQKFKKVNATDAQAYRTLTSYRAILDMQGKWNDAMVAAFDRFDKGQWSKEDFKVVWGAIKPFLFANVKVADGLGEFQRVPHHHKNSEFLLLAFLNKAYLGTMMKNSPQLRGLNRAMENFDIDVAMYESAVKAGGQGIIDITHNKEKLQELVNSPEWAVIQEQAIQELGEKEYKKASNYSIWKASKDYQLDNGLITQEKYNSAMSEMLPSEDDVYRYIEEALHDKDKANSTDLFEANEKGVVENKNVVHEIPYEHYMIAQPTVNHLVDAESVVGSQFKNLITADMPDDLEITIQGKVFKANNNGVNEIRELFQKLMIENLLDDWEETVKLFSDTNSLHDKLMQMVKGNPSYGMDILNALQVVDIDGVPQFNVPIHTSTLSTKLEQLILSIFKNNITKQYMKGAACVLVSSYGFDDDLHVIRDSQGAITHFQCMLPAHTKDLFEDYLIPVKDANGKVIGREIDIKKIPTELLEGIGFRIPSEGMYSFANLMVVGFLPQQCGACMMLPAETTTLAGEDFDVDKKFILLKEHKIKYNLKVQEMWKDFYNAEENQDVKDDVHMHYVDALVKFYNDKDTNVDIYDLEDTEFEKIEAEFREYCKANNIKHHDLGDKKWVASRFNKWFGKIIKEQGIENTKYFISKEIEIAEYDVNKLPQEMSRAARNNLIVDISRAIMAHPKTAYRINNPGNYDNISIESNRCLLWTKEYFGKFKEYIETRYNGSKPLSNEDIAKAILWVSEEEMEDFFEDYKEPKNPLDLETFAYYHNQNMAGGKLISIFANNNIMQAKYQQSDLGLDNRNVFILNGFVVDSLHEQSRTIDDVSTLLSNNCAEFSDASVDNVKDPKLANMMQSPDNAFITGTMLRAGLTIKEIGLFYSLPFFSTKLKDVLDTSGSLQLFKSNTPIEITSEDLAMAIINPEQADKVKAVLAKLILVANRVNDLTNISRSDSPNGAVSNTLAGAICQIFSVDSFFSQEQQEHILSGIDSIIHNRIANYNDTKDIIRKAIYESKMPLLQAFHFLGIESALGISSSQFRQLGQQFMTNLKHLAIEYKFPNIQERIVNKYLKEAVVYGLSKSDLFNKDINKQRMYYRNKFPSDFVKAKQNPDIAKYGIMKAMSIGEYGDIIIQDASRLEGVDALFKRDLNLMLSDPNPEISEFAVNLFKYSYFIDGLGWRPNGFSQFFDSLFITSIPSVIDTLRSLTFDSSDGVDWANFHTQFVRNNAKLLFKDIKVSGVQQGAEEIYVENELVANPNNHKYPYEMVFINGVLYQYDMSRSAPKNAAYILVDYIIDFSPVYDANNSDIDSFISDYAKADALITRPEPVEEVEEPANAGEEFDSDDYEYVPYTGEEDSSVPQEFNGNEEFDNEICPIGGGKAEFSL